MPGVVKVIWTCVMALFVSGAYLAYRFGSLGIVETSTALDHLAAVTFVAAMGAGGALVVLHNMAEVR